MTLPERIGALLLLDVFQFVPYRRAGRVAVIQQGHAGGFRV
eukprot:CAMPEP_0113597642 /NCGR_PEP_ID=MMETSP0015_2-20120614/41135_1 /TAXON_ID=2838 /ORGANISM="Odontella" /LENGTH=40 /DNA_ID=CAMNT_0000505551 /DNA_START=641 /DNA_END=760 /DNA_ORIENTATION=- /assembly_acc=CAM_ASM_000160